MSTSLCFSVASSSILLSSLVPTSKQSKTSLKTLDAPTVAHLYTAVTVVEVAAVVVGNSRAPSPPIDPRCRRRTLRHHMATGPGSRLHRLRCPVGGVGLSSSRDTHRQAGFRHHRCRGEAKINSLAVSRRLLLRAKDLHIMLVDLGLVHSLQL